MAFGKALEADLPDLFLRSDANSKSLVVCCFGELFQTFLIVDPRSVDSKSLATLALLGAFGAFQGLLTFCADLSAPD